MINRFISDEWFARQLANADDRARCFMEMSNESHAMFMECRDKNHDLRRQIAARDSVIEVMNKTLDRYHARIAELEKQLVPMRGELDNDNV